MSAAAAAPADRTHSPPRNGPSSAPESGTSVWLNAWHDPVAGLQTHGACVRLVDLYGDGDSKLLVADVGRKLTVFKGVQMISDHALLDVPVAIACYYPDNITPRCPTVGVAAGEHIFIYRNLRPHYRFTVPSVPVAQEETEIWEGLRQQPEPDVEEAIASIARLRDAGTKLTSCSLDLLGIQDTALAYEFVQAEKHTPLAQHASITCMEVLAKSEDSELGMSCLVIGTESRKVYILKHTGYSISCEATLPSVPVLMAVTGSVAVGFRIVVACRDAKVYTIKGSNATAETNVGTSMVIELESQPCGLVRTGKSIIIGCMGNQFHSYHIKGKKNFTVYLPSSITQMELLDMKGVARQVQACIVAMANGEVRVYNGKSLVSTFNCHDQVTALRYGKFGRESNALVLAHKSGALSVKMLPRNVDLEKSKMPVGPPPEQDIPLDIPKKTKLYIEQTARERDSATEMHRIFQRDLCKLRLSTARSYYRLRNICTVIRTYQLMSVACGLRYVKVLTDGHGPLSYTAGSSLRLSPQVQGLGPIFRLKLDIQNTGNRPIFDVPLAFSYNQHIYCLSQHMIRLPVLIPGVLYCNEVAVNAIADGGGVSDAIRVFVLSPDSAVPVITATVNMSVVSIVLVPPAFDELA